jgi:hypothetical protein
LKTGASQFAARSSWQLRDFENLRRQHELRKPVLEEQMEILHVDRFTGALHYESD